MTSLKTLVDENGLGIVVDNDCSFEYGSNPFTVVSENSHTYSVKYKNGMICDILKECEFSDDYHVV